MHLVSRRGVQSTLVAKNFVIAAGGIENARLLLLSEIGGVATGKYFMDHSKGVLGHIMPSAGYRFPQEWLKIGTQSGTYRIGLRISDTVQRSRQLLNPYIQLEPLFPQGIFQKGLRLSGYPVQPERFAVMCYFEQAPSAANYVSLTSETDSLGMQRAEVSFELGEQDKASMLELLTLLKERVEAEHMGIFASPLLSGSGDWSKVRDASHHMGTTRMGKDPQTSVVDTDCKVHEVENLYIAGSSVFPTGGNANPTATLLALALRLADHLVA